MITNVTIMLYVTDVPATTKFWQTYLDFKLTETFDFSGYSSVVLKSSDGFAIQLFDREFITKVSPEVSLNTPSLMLKTADIYALHNKLQASGHFLSEITEQGASLVFNFADNEERFFAVASF